MIDKEYILSKATGVEDQFEPAVYVLMDGDEIVYVGKSTNPYGRICSHLSDKIFDKFTILHAKDFLIEDNEFAKTYPCFEELLIMKFDPKYNKSIVGLVYINSNNIKRETGLGKREIKRLVLKYKIGYAVLHGIIYYVRKDIYEAIDKESNNE